MQGRHRDEPQPQGPGRLSSRSQNGFKYDSPNCGRNALQLLDPMIVETAGERALKVRQPIAG
jgi:hypothetical protein